MSAEVLSLAQQQTAGHEHSGSNKLFGFWIYLMSDCLLFAAIFATYAVLSRNYAGGPSGRELFHLPYVLGETMLLLTSSLSYGFAMLALHRGRQRQVFVWLLVTFLLGLGFFGMEIREFGELIGAGHGPQRSGFLSAFFTLVGTHGAHIVFGLIWMAVMMVQLAAYGLTAVTRTRLMCLSLFWHFLDIVWIGVFTIVFLMGVM
jgi:cytochrome o ubiquinol oxidase subunit III